MRPTSVFLKTIRLRLREAGIRKWHAKKRALLTKKQAKRRYQWAKEHRHLTRDDFASILFSDESLFKKNNDGHQKLVFRHQTKEEKYAPQNIQGKKKGAQDYRRWSEDALSAISLVHLFLLTVQSMEVHIFSCCKTSYRSLTSFEKTASIMLSFNKTMLLLIVQKRP
jgi:hypothetical protein